MSPHPLSACCHQPLMEMRSDAPGGGAGAAAVPAYAAAPDHGSSSMPHAGGGCSQARPSLPDALPAAACA